MMHRRNTGVGGVWHYHLPEHRKNFTGTYAVKAVYNSAWAGFDLNNSAGVTTNNYNALAIAVHGGTTGGQNLYAYVFNNAGSPLLPAVNIGTYITGGIPANGWQLATFHSPHCMQQTQPSKDSPLRAMQRRLCIMTRSNSLQRQLRQRRGTYSPVEPAGDDRKLAQRPQQDQFRPTISQDQISSLTLVVPW